MLLLLGTAIAYIIGDFESSLRAGNCINVSTDECLRASISLSLVLEEFILTVASKRDSCYKRSRL